MHKVAGHPSCAVAALPTAFLAEVLQHVPQQQRLGQCALVSTSWKLAAAQATTHVIYSIRPDAVPALQSWLALHAGQLEHLDLSERSCAHPPVLQLPVDKFTKLKYMRLQNFELQLPDKQDSSVSDHVAGRDSSSDDSSSLAAPQLTLPSLQRLELVYVKVGSVSSLLQITNAPQLTSLGLSSISVVNLGYNSNSWAQKSAKAVQAAAGAVARMLQQLPRLSVLQLPDLPFTDAVAQQMAAMQGLQQLILRHVQELPMGDLQKLPSSITQLVVHGTHSNDSPSLPSELLQLSGLLHLTLSGCLVPPTALASLTQLQVLSLDDCNLVPFVTLIGENTAEGTIALLRALSQLSCLRELELCLPCLSIVGVAATSFSALTSSSHLTRLDLSPEHKVCLPKGAVQHMFPPGRQMLSLQCLTIEQTVYGDEEDSDDEDDAWCIDSAGLGYILMACPALQGLHITNSVQPGADVSPLLELPHSCTQLWVGGTAFTDAAAPMLAQLMSGPTGSLSDWLLA